MKYISATELEIVRRRINNIPAIEITSYEQLEQLKLNQEIAIMDNITMVLAEIYRKENGYITVWNKVHFINVYPSDFKYGNFIYKI